MSNQIVTPFTANEAVNMQQFNARIQEINQGAATAESVEQILNGTTAVGNASELSGHPLTDFIVGNVANPLDGVDLNTVIKNGMYGVMPTCTNIPPGVTNGGYMISILYRTGDKWAIQIFITWEGYKKIYVRNTSNAAGSSWGDWWNVADGGDASALSGKPITNGGGKAGVAYIGSDYGALEIGSYIDFHVASGTDYDARIRFVNDLVQLYNIKTAAQNGIVMTSAARCKVFVQSGTPSGATGDIWLW